MKYCNGCGANLSTTQFSRGSGGREFRSRCRSCETKAARLYRLAHPKKVRRIKRNWSRKNPESVKRTLIRVFARRLGYNPDQILKWWQEHPKTCDICGVGTDKEKMAIDHCHTTGVIRGLLCERCNHGLGHFKDDPERLREAANYLEAD